jgi:hypothetical protein
VVLAVKARGCALGAPLRPLVTERVQRAREMRRCSSPMGEAANVFVHQADFAEHRNRLGGLLLLPKSFNASYGALPFEEKQHHYNTQNLLAQSLHPQCYEHNLAFIQFVKRSGLPFRPHEHFNMADLEERSALYQLIAERIWDPEQLLREVK